MMRLAVSGLCCGKGSNSNQLMPARKPIRIAMWSGPRNISTAMMRSWGNRPDTAVVDEPFYAHYLQASGADHPGAAEIIATGETDWRRVVASLAGDAPDGKGIFYQKQMTHHLLPAIDRAWLGELTNCFLIRDPAEVIASYTKKNHVPLIEDIGFVQQAEIFDQVRAQTGRIPPVIDARDVLENPERALRLLCEAVGIEFLPAMLSWPSGPRDTDGVWAKHWYAEVERSTCFRPPRQAAVDVPQSLDGVYRQSLEIYRRLREHRLR
jgi:sulfotransferase family protein